MLSEIQGLEFLFYFLSFSPPCGVCGVGQRAKFTKERSLDTRHELLAHISDAAACIEKREDQLRRKTRELRTRVSECTEVDGWI